MLEGLWGWLSGQLARLRLETAVTGGVGFLMAWGVTRILDAGVQNTTARDIGVVSVVVISIVGFWALAIFGSRQSKNGETRQGDQESRKESHEGDRRTPADGPSGSTPLPTGETPVRSVTSSPFNSTRGEADAIDYYTEEVYDRTRKMGNLAGLKLGEIALLRRLAVAEGGLQIRRRCETALQASGVAQPESSIARLEDMNLIVVPNAHDAVVITELGRELVYIFSQLLTHDSALVTAYRRVTPTINSTIRFDGRALRG